MNDDKNQLSNTLVLEKSSEVSKRILVIDDDESAKNFIVDALKAKKYQVDSSETIEEALAKLKTIHFDIILSDINFPNEEFSGIDLFRFCKENYPKTPFILLTGAPQLDDAVAILKEGAADYLTKPIQLGKLYDRVEQIFTNISSFQIDPVIASVVSHIPSEYKIIRLIDKTETSIVLLVEKDGIYYAMKILKFELMDEHNKKKVERFFREAKIMRSIKHPNIVRVFEYRFMDDQIPYIVSEYISGKQFI